MVVFNFLINFGFIMSTFSVQQPNIEYQNFQNESLEKVIDLNSFSDPIEYFFGDTIDCLTFEYNQDSALPTNLLSFFCSLPIIHNYHTEGYLENELLNKRMKEIDISSIGKISINSNYSSYLFYIIDNEFDDLGVIEYIILVNELNGKLKSIMKIAKKEVLIGHEIQVKSVIKDMNTISTFQRVISDDIINNGEVKNDLDDKIICKKYSLSDEGLIEMLNGAI